MKPKILIYRYRPEFGKSTLLTSSEKIEFSNFFVRCTAFNDYPARIKQISESYAVSYRQATFIVYQLKNIQQRMLASLKRGLIKMNLPLLATSDENLCKEYFECAKLMFSRVFARYANKVLRRLF